jgi:hypothetical protein
MNVDHAIDFIRGHLQTLDEDERLLLIARIMAPFDVVFMPKSARQKPARKAGQQADNALAWRDTGNERFDGLERHGYEAATATGSYGIHPESIRGKFGGYTVVFTPTGSEPGQLRRIKDGVRTAEQAMAIAQRDHDRQFGARVRS